MITLSALIDDVEHEVRGNLDARLNTVSIVNEAGLYLYSMHPWRWRQRPPASLSFEEGSQFVELPGDFGFGAIDDVALSSRGSAIQQTTLGEIQRWREQSIGTPGNSYYCAISYPSQQDSEKPMPRARLEIYPTPAATQNNAIALTYRAGWLTLTDPDSAASIPEAYDHLLRMITRAITRDYIGPWVDNLDAINETDWLMTLKRTDGSSQSFSGPVRGGILQQGYATNNQSFTTVNPGD